MALILIGSCLYWILSSQLISSFTVLAPGAFRSTNFGMTLVLVVGVISSVAGFWIIPVDFDKLARLFARNDGWVFTVPIALATIDIYLTLIGLAGSRVVELNPFVASAAQIGTMAMIPSFLSYIALSEGLALVMLSAGSGLFGPIGSRKFLPFATICGAAAFGPVNNLMLITSPTGWPIYLFAGGATVLFATWIFFQFERPEFPSAANSGMQ